MIARGLRRQLSAAALAWPSTGSATPTAVRDTFGPRTFSPHIATLGYDYDFHRGSDIPAAAGDPIYAAMAGSIIRQHWTHFGWEHARQLARWVAAGTGATFAQAGASSLRVTGERVGARTFPATTANYYPVSERVDVSSDDWEIRLKLTSNPALVGGVLGFGLVDVANGQHVALEYDGLTSTARGAHAAGAMAASGTASTATAVYLSITYTLATDTITWRRSNNATTWTTIATQAGIAFSREGWPAFQPALYWRSIDTSSTAQVVDVDLVGWWDAASIGRFGNWVTIGRGDRKVAQMHFQDLVVSIGDIVEAGQLLGYAGSTGFDTRSGHILEPHCHVEYSPNGTYFYSNADGINPLGTGILPRVDVSSNVAAIITTANDPDGAECWKIAVVIARADEDLDLNAITLTGDVATRTVNFNTRAGLNADNDIPKQAGVYIVPHDFDETSATLAIDFYFSKAVVGSIPISAAIADTAGTTLWSGSA